MIQFIGFTSLFCTGLFVTTWPGMLLHPLTVVYDCATSRHRRLCRAMRFLRNPLFGCMYCMASWWTLVSWVVQGCPFAWWMLPFYMCGVCGCNAVLFALIRHTVPGYEGN